MVLDIFFRATPAQLRGVLTLSLQTAGAARGVRAAADASTGSRAQKQEKLSQSRLDALEREATRQVEAFTKLKVRQKRVVNIVEKAVERLHDMKALMLEAREHVVKANNPELDDAARRAHASKVDQLLGQLNLKMRGAGFAGVNMIGSSIRDVHQGQDVELPIRPGSLATRTFSGVYLGSDYRVTDLSGNVFMPDLFGATLVPFPPGADDDEGLLVRASDAVVVDEATGAISFTREGEAEPYLEGLLERKGLGVPHSWYYGRLVDQDSRDRALADVEGALSKLRFHITTFEGFLTQANVAADFSDKQITENRQAGSRIRADKSIAEQRFALEERRRQLLFESALQSTLSFNGSGLPLALRAPSLFDFEV